MITGVIEFPKRIVGHVMWRYERFKWRQEQRKRDRERKPKEQYIRTVLTPKYSLPEIELSAIIPPAELTTSLIMDDICMPPFYGSLDHDDIHPLLQIVNAIQPKIFLELGTAHGNTTANVCNQSAGTSVYTVNAPAEEQTGDLVTFELSCDEVGRVYRKYNFQNRVTQIFQNTLKLNLSEYFDSPVIDMAIIDACHDAEYVVNDFFKVQPFIRPGGIVLLHDTHPSMRDHLIGSYEACLELRRAGYEIMHLRDTWWGVWINHPAVEPS